MAKRPIDYTTIGNGKQESPISNDRAWWKLNREEIASAVHGVVTFLDDNQSRRINQNQRSARLYGNMPLIGLNSRSSAKMATTQSSLSDRISYNVCQSAVDTITSKICKNKPRPMFLTSGGDYKIQRKAKKLDQFCEGVFYENKAYEMGELIFRDACVFDAGIVHVFNHYGRVTHERVLSRELLVDEIEAQYGKPRQMHRVKNVDRMVLCDLFPEKRKAILAANAATPDKLGGYENVADCISVTESWHLPSGPNASDGCHVICTESELLRFEDYKKDFFPFAILRWNHRLEGYWGQGLVEQIQNIQVEINKLLWVIQRSMHLAGSFKVFLENGSKIIKEHLNNDIGAIVSYTGTPPQYVTPPIVAPEVYQHFMTLKNSAFEVAGISQLSATSQKPAGLNSGKALREYNDIETDRFQTVGQGFEQFFLDLARLDVDCAKDIYEEEGSYEVKVPGKKFIETIDWKDVDMADDEYVMKLYPVSSLPNTPEGRLQTITEYMQAGFLTPRAGRRLLDFPDLEAEEKLANSTEDYLLKILDKIIEEGVYTAPEPYDDLNLAKELCLEYYAQGKCSGLEEPKLDLLRQFSDEINQFDQSMQQAQELMQMGQQAQEMVSQQQSAPQAVPEAPPVSDMLPNMAA